MVFTPYGIGRNRQDELMKQLPISRILHFLSLPDTALIRVYSYQGKEAFDAAEKRGYWTGVPEGIEGLGSHHFSIAYEWMQKKMAERLPDYSGDLPIWAWLKRPSTKNKETWITGTGGQVRITALVPKSRVLLSDFNSWHSVLNLRYLALTELEWENNVHRGVKFDSDYTTIIEGSYDDVIPSWDKCFTFNPRPSQEEIAWFGCKKYYQVQACVDRIYPNEIVGVKWFPNSKHKKRRQG